VGWSALCGRPGLGLSLTEGPDVGSQFQTLGPMGPTTNILAVSQIAEDFWHACGHDRPDWTGAVLFAR
jgi:hypothetical protein